MNTVDFTIWMETCTGQRTLIASSSCQTLAMLVGEAVWAHFCQIRASILDVSLIEVLRSSSSCESDAPQLVARWSVSGQEKLHGSSAARSMSATEIQTVLSPTRSLRDPRPSVSEQQVTDSAGSLGLAAFFPTAEEWEPWKAWREREL